MFEEAFSQLQQSMAQWGKLWQDQLEHMDSATEEVVKLQQHGVARTGQAIDEMATLGKASLQYASRVGAQWRRVNVEAWRRSAEIMTPASPWLRDPPCNSAT
jgi:hypothetical protein